MDEASIESVGFCVLINYFRVVVDTARVDESD